MFLPIHYGSVFTTPKVFLYGKFAQFKEHYTVCTKIYSYRQASSFFANVSIKSTYTILPKFCTTKVFYYIQCIKWLRLCNFSNNIGTATHSCGAHIPIILHSLSHMHPPLKKWLTITLLWSCDCYYFYIYSRNYS